MSTRKDTKADVFAIYIAFQRLPLRFQRDGRPIRPDGEFENSDECGESGGVQGDFS